ncbi:MAG: hypothetical protein HQ526_04785, partial [Actinobacteria bacterium]|nr:hypothetical protein [Actinomycetota bacterium]
AQLSDRPSVGVIGLSTDVARTPNHWRRLSGAVPIEDLPDYARALYASLRLADDLGLDEVVALLPPTESVGLAPAIRDRLQRAATRA